ncbi:J domain-containing protein [Pseudoflavitalea sp. G-6-1-2]|uniref:J domain-containing protein n=1 Tax=Pseudoflavitalea sp. G-6-1-2 TaxID=2728841 RepID=UPI00146C45B2|nr:J domain-containing protein [Pseudoflavitalea sp. G-6-1-2]NML21053.1 J domain-containing protein [Pseudoflavitalea sp. G-6-1-2]
MSLKDYYTILEVTPVATLQEIKRSFRKLALKYHPDKNDGDQLSAARFVEIQEAYEILSNPKRREAYNYERWYVRYKGEGYANRPLTPDELLSASSQLKETVAGMNHFRLDFNSLSYSIQQLLSQTNIGILQQYKNEATNRSIIQNLVHCADALPLQHYFPVHDLLLQLAGDDALMHDLLHQNLRIKKQRSLWDRYKWVVVLLITALLCWLMMAVAGE